MATNTTSSEELRLQREQHNNAQPLLELPAELRLLIYSYLLPTDQIIDIQDPRLWHSFNVQFGSYDDGPQLLMQGLPGGQKKYNHNIALRITQTSQKIRHESTHHYYSSNTFLVRADSFQRYCFTMDWIDTLPTGNLQSVRRFLLVESGPCKGIRKPSDRVWLLDLEKEIVRYVHTGGPCQECVERQKGELRGVQLRFSKIMAEKQGGHIPRAQFGRLLESYAMRVGRNDLSSDTAKDSFVRLFMMPIG